MSQRSTIRPEGSPPRSTGSTVCGTAAIVGGGDVGERVLDEGAAKLADGEELARSQISLSVHQGARLARVAIWSMASSPRQNASTQSGSSVARRAIATTWWARLAASPVRQAGNNSGGVVALADPQRFVGEQCDREVDQPSMLGIGMSCDLVECSVEVERVAGFERLFVSCDCHEKEEHVRSAQTAARPQKRSGWSARKGATSSLPDSVGPLDGSCQSMARSGSSQRIARSQSGAYTPLTL